MKRAEPRGPALIDTVRDRSEIDDPLAAVVALGRALLRAAGTVAVGLEAVELLLVAGAAQVLDEALELRALLLETAAFLVATAQFARPSGRSSCGVRRNRRMSG